MFRNQFQILEKDKKWVLDPNVVSWNFTITPVPNPLLKIIANKINLRASDEAVGWHTSTVAELGT